MQCRLLESPVARRPSRLEHLIEVISEYAFAADRAEHIIAGRCCDVVASDFKSYYKFFSFDLYGSVAEHSRSEPASRGSRVVLCECIVAPRFDSPEERSFFIDSKHYYGSSEYLFV